MSSTLNPFVLSLLKQFNQKTSTKIHFGGIKKSSPNLTHNDRLVIYLPYSNRLLLWELHFDAKHMDAPPDFLFCGSVKNPLLVSNNLSSLPTFSGSYNNSNVHHLTNVFDTHFVDFRKLKSIHQWSGIANSKKDLSYPECFCNLMNELIEEFKRFHRQIVSCHPSQIIQFEYQTISGMKNINYYITRNQSSAKSSHSCPIPIDNSITDQGNSENNNIRNEYAGFNKMQSSQAFDEIHFVIPYKDRIDSLKQLIEMKIDESRQKSSKPIDGEAILILIYRIDRFSGTVIQKSAEMIFPDIICDYFMYSTSNDLQEPVGGNDDHQKQQSKRIKLPKFTSEVCIMEYIVSVDDVIRRSMKSVTSKLKRKEFMKELVEVMKGKNVQQPEELLLRNQMPVIPNGLLEMDTYHYLKISFLVSYESQMYILIIQLPDEFPEEPPVIFLRSAQHTQKHKKHQPIQFRVQNLTYDGQWPMKEMAVNIREYILQMQESFKKAIQDQL